MDKKLLRAQLLIEASNILSEYDESLNESFIKDIFSKINKKVDDNRKRYMKDQSREFNKVVNDYKKELSSSNKKNIVLYQVDGGPIYLSEKMAWDYYFFPNTIKESNFRCVKSTDYPKINKKYPMYKIVVDDYEIINGKNVIKHVASKEKIGEVSVKDGSKYGVKIVKGADSNQRKQIISMAINIITEYLEKMDNAYQNQASKFSKVSKLDDKWVKEYISLEYDDTIVVTFNISNISPSIKNKIKNDIDKLMGIIDSKLPDGQYVTYTTNNDIYKVYILEINNRYAK